MREARVRGHEVGIHCYDHIKWQDGLARMDRNEVFEEFARARTEFHRVFGTPAGTAGAAGWQANALSLAAYDEEGLLYASDARGTHPFFPRIGRTRFRTLQIPTTLPTLDELLGRTEYPDEKIVGHYLSLLRTDAVNVLTIHAEIEGMSKTCLFRSLLEQIRSGSATVRKLEDVARDLLREPSAVPVCRLETCSVEGRSGTLAVQNCMP
jgi:peptidoglycan/xylan/chitin deacetylase (PgdA/CDA1 family)